MATLLERLRRLEAARRATVGDLSYMSDAALMQVACRGLLQALSGLGPLPEAVRALLRRLDTGRASDADLQLLAGLPECSLAPHDLVKLLVDLEASC